MDKNYSLHESNHYNRLEGELYSPLFGQKIRFLAKSCDEVYAIRCAEYFETVTENTVRCNSALYALAEGAAAYILDLIDENDFELGNFTFDEGTPGVKIFKALTPTALVFEKFKLLDDEDCPVAFSLIVNDK